MEGHGEEGFDGAVGVGEELGWDAVVDDLEEAVGGARFSDEPSDLSGGFWLAREKAGEVDEGDGKLLMGVWGGFFAFGPDELGGYVRLLAKEGCIKLQRRRRRRGLIWLGVGVTADHSWY